MYLTFIWIYVRNDYIEPYFQPVVYRVMFNSYNVEKSVDVRFGSHFEPWWKLAANVTRVMTCLWISEKPYVDSVKDVSVL